MRNYKKEYKNYHSSSEQKKKRASRNTARAKLVKLGKVKKGDAKDVSHRNGNPKDNKTKNLGVSTKNKNRSFKRTKTAKKVNKKA